MAPDVDVSKVSFMQIVRGSTQQAAARHETRRQNLCVYRQPIKLDLRWTCHRAGLLFREDVAKAIAAGAKVIKAFNITYAARFSRGW